MSKLSRRELLRAISGGAGLTCCAESLSAASHPPLNFVFFLIDDMGWRDAHCYGSELYETPHIDRLAAQGMKFTNAYAAAPLCSPTRASILTGKYPARLHLTTALPGRIRPKPADKFLSVEMPPGLPLSETTIAEALKPAGYVSASIGKWHLGAEDYYPEKQGFDVSIAGFDGGMTPDFFYPGWRGKKRGVPLDGRSGEHLTDRLTEEALRFLDASKDKPFFLYLPHYAVHTPIQAKPEIIEKYKRKVDPSQPQHHPIYAAMIESVDDSVGKVIRKLDELGISGRTVVFFMSDNGGVPKVQTYTSDPLPPTSNLPLREGKATLYEGGIREPMIVRWPGVVKPGSVCDVPVISNDFFPTIVEMAGLKLSPQYPNDGVNLTPLLRQKGRLKRDALYWHFPHYDYKPVSVIRRGDFKLMEFIHDGHLELYNLAEDLGEQNNLAGKMPEKAAELRRMLHDWLKAVDAQRMPPNPGYQPDIPGVKNERQAN